MFTTYRVARLRPEGQARGKRPLNALFDIVGSKLKRTLNRARAEQVHGKNCRTGTATRSA